MTALPRLAPNRFDRHATATTPAQAAPDHSTPAHSTPAHSTPAHSTPAETGLDLHVAQLLCARLCHDLMSPAGAVDIGLGLYAGSAGGDADALALAADGAREVISRLKLFRLVFGAGGGATTHGAEAERLLGRLLAARRVTLAWRPADIGGDGPSELLRLAVCLILSAADALPRGGTITIDGETSTPRLALHARGTPMCLRDDIIEALTAPDREALSAYNVHAYYARRLAERLGLSLRFARTADDALAMIAEPAATPAVEWFDLPAAATGEAAHRAPARAPVHDRRRA